MDKLSIKLIDKKNEVMKEHVNEGSVFLGIRHGYALGDYFEVEVEKVPTFLVVSMDEAIGESLIYVTEKQWKYEIPFDLQREWPYPRSAFNGGIHYVKARYASEEEIKQYRNVALNVHDQRENNSGAFPHATANAETRGEYVFFAKNAIDGILANEKHGNYPYQSWGINQNDDAEMTVELGTLYDVDQIGITLRADYPHDSYWTEMTVEFSDGSEEVLHPIKTADTQNFKFDTKRVSWFKLKKLIKDTDMSTFPALTQVQLFGKSV